MLLPPTYGKLDPKRRLRILFFNALIYAPANEMYIFPFGAYIVSFGASNTLKLAQLMCRFHCD